MTAILSQSCICFVLVFQCFTAQELEGVVDSYSARLTSSHDVALAASIDNSVGPS